MEELRLHELSHARAREVCASGAPIYVLVNPLEYHGPHLSLRNDALCAAGFAREIHAAFRDAHPNWPLVLGAEIVGGVEPTRGAGSARVSYAALCRLLVDACAALCDLGARRVVLMTFHGHPLHNLALEAGVKACMKRGVRAFAPLSVLLREMLAFDPDDPKLRAAFAPAFAHIEAPETREALYRGLGEDFHAGFFETSLALHFAPQSVDPSFTALPPCPTAKPDRVFRALSRAAAGMGKKNLAAELRYAALGRGWDALDPFPGYTSAPAYASREAGAVFAREITLHFAAAARAVLDEGAPGPEPIMRWLRAVTLGGRIN
jgi:creatinine amidohydrolase